LGKYVVGTFHHELLGLEHDIEWRADEVFGRRKLDIMPLSEQLPIVVFNIA